MVTRRPVTTSSAFNTLLPSRQAAGLPFSVRYFVNVGTNAALIAPSANSSRTRFGMRNATTNASISFPAPKTAASTVSRARPSTRLVSVAIPATPAERPRRSVDGALGSSEAEGLSAEGAMRLGAAEFLSDEIVDALSIDGLTSELRHHRFHHTSHVLGRRRPGFGDRLRNCTVDERGIGGSWQIRFEHGDFCGFIVDEILASTLGELFDGIAPLFHERLHHLTQLAVIE